MHRAALQAKLRGSADGTGGKEPPGAEVVEAIQDAPRGSVGKGLRGYRLTQEEFGVLLGEKLFSAVQWAAATERIQDETEHDRACV